MSTAAPASNELAPPKKWELWTGRVLTALPALMLTFSAAMKLSHAPQVVEMFTGKFGFPEKVLGPIGILGKVTVAPRRPMSFEVIDPMTGAVLAAHDLEADQQVEIAGADALLLRGAYK